MSFQQAFNQLNSELGHSSVLRQFEARTNIPKEWGVGGGAIFYLLLIFLNIGGIGQLFANLAAVAIPGYFSLQALETPGTNDDTQFLTYWVVYAAFSILEFWSSIILYWIPFYWFFKTIFFLYLGLPQFGGAKLVYDRVLRPFSVNVLGIRPNTAQNLKERVSGAATGSTRF